MDDVAYRNATESDLDAMFELWLEMQTSHVAYDATWYAPKPEAECKPICMKHFRQCLSGENSMVLLATLDNQPIGMLIGHITGRPAPLQNQITVLAIENAIVAEAYRRQGVLRGMMDLMTAEARTRGASAVKFSVHSSNVARIAYEHLGFSCHEMSMGKYLE